MTTNSDDQQQQAALDHGVVTVGDAVEHHAAHPGPRKDGFDDDGAAEQAGELNPQNR